MAGMNYSAVAPSTSQSGSIDLFEITAPSDAAVAVTGLFVGQSSDYGDATAKGLKVQLVKGYATSGSGGSAVTPTPLEAGFAAAGSQVEANNTTLASAGTPLAVHEDNFNLQIGYQLRLTPEEWIWLSPSQRLVVRLSAPADSVTIGGTLYFKEVGG